MNQVSFFEELNRILGCTKENAFIKDKLILKEDLSELMGRIDFKSGAEFDVEFKSGEKFIIFVDGVFYGIAEQDCSIRKMEVEIEANWCKCFEKKMKYKYQKHFAPTNFKLLGSLDSESTILVLEGYCKDCNGYLCTGISFNNTTENKQQLLFAIWKSFNHYRPYEVKNDLGEYFKNGLKERIDFYRKLDCLNIDDKKDMFRQLFNPKDSEVVEDFLETITSK